MGCGASRSEMRLPSRPAPAFRETGLIFAVNGVVQCLDEADVDPSMKLATYLRDVFKLRGTKIGCGEGGCGACAVLLSSFDPVMNKVVTVSVNACLRPLTSIHGFNVVTVEGIGGPSHKNGPHAVQQKFADMNASQCGYCTPGFVVSVYGQLAKKEANSIEDMEGCIDGNLCRCTGYRPIMDAAKTFAVSDVESSQPSEGGAIQAELDAMFPDSLKDLPKKRVVFKNNDLWVARAESLDDVKDLLKDYPEAKLVCSQTSAGIYKTHLPNETGLIDISRVAALSDISATKEAVHVGANVSLSGFHGALLQHSAQGTASTKQAFGAVGDIVRRIANSHIRNVGSIGGNLAMCKELGFASDLATPLCVLARVKALRFTKNCTEVKEIQIPMLDFLSAASEEGERFLLLQVVVPFLTDRTVVLCYRTAIRSIHAHCIANGALRATISVDGTLSNVDAVFGAVGEFDVPGKNAPRRNDAIVKRLTGKRLTDKLIDELSSGFSVGDFVRGDYKVAHRKQLVKTFCVRFLEELLANVNESKPFPTSDPWGVHRGTQKFTPATHSDPLGQPMVRPDGVHHASGTAEYISDMKELINTLYGAYVISTCAHGAIRDIDVESGLKMPGIKHIIRGADVKTFPWGNNTVVNLCRWTGAPESAFADWEMIAECNVNHVGEVIALVLGTSISHAQRAAKKLTESAKFLPIPSAITIEQWRGVCLPLLGTTEIKSEEVEASQCNKSLQHAKVKLTEASQKHFYMETNAALAIPHDHKMEVFVPCQVPEYTAAAVAHAISVPMSEVAIVHYRTGGSFGGKAMGDHACIAAVAAKMTGCPVKIHLDRNTDMHIQGGREDTNFVAQADFDRDGKIHGVEVEAVKNFGIRADLSYWTVSANLPKNTMSCYAAPKKFTSSGVLTNTVNRTMMRAPGECEAAFISETIIDLVAYELGLHSTAIREKNFREATDDEVFTIPDMYKRLMDGEGWRQLVADSIAFNASSRHIKKGVAISPFAYHVVVERANVLINIYRDGSVLVHHSGVEIGQAVILKTLQGANSGLSKLLGAPLPMSLFRSAGNQTQAIPTQLFTGGSTTSEANVLAALDAAKTLVERLKPVADSLPADEKTWENIVIEANKKDILLSATGQCDSSSLKYECFCVGAAAVTTDVRSGQVTVDRVDVKYDAARSLNPTVDIGQVEGAFIMGLGHILLEDPYQNPSSGWLEHNGTWDYKIPSVNDVPREFNIELIENDNFTKGVNSSKATGEPPLCVAASIASAVRQCIASAREDAGIKGFAAIGAPFTPDKVALACIGEEKK